LTRQIICEGTSTILRIFIGHESSGVIRRAAQNLGCFAISCDLLPSEDNSPDHIIGDVFKELRGLDIKFDAAIFHPDCTYLTNSAAWAFTDGPYHQKVKPETKVGHERRIARDEALEHVRALLGLDIPRIIIENPPGSISTRIQKPTQIIQPWQFGDDASKATALYTKNVPPIPLDPALFVKPRMVNGLPRWANQTDTGQNRLTPSPDRWKQRAKTYPGIAKALVSHLTTSGT